MVFSNPGEAKPLSLNDVLALNEEIIALVRAGVPLELGLGLAAADLPGRLSGLLQRLSDRLTEGKSLPDALADADGDIPEMYRAVVEAGVRSGRISSALEAMTTTLRRIIELRRIAGAALIYPILVMIVAWTLFFSLVYFFGHHYASFEILRDFIPSWAKQLAPWSLVLGALLPALVVVVAVTWWRMSYRAATTAEGRLSWLMAWIPTAGKTHHYSSMSVFSDVIGLLVEQEVPLDEALRLACATSGSAKLAVEGRAAAEAVARGQNLAEATSGLPSLPAFLGLSLYAGGDSASLARTARHAAMIYAQRAEHIAEWSRTFVPVFFTLAFGASTTLAYAILLAWPWFTTLQRLTLP